MSKIMLIINLVLSCVILAWISVAYFEYKKQSSNDSVPPGIDLTYLPNSPSFTAEQTGVQFNASYFINTNAKFPPKLIYLLAPPMSELSDNLLQLNLAAATSKITIENQNISVLAMDLFSPNAPLIGQRFRGDAQSLTTSRATQFSVNIDPPINVRLSNFDPETMLSSQITDPSQLSTSAPVTPVAEFPNAKLIKITSKSPPSPIMLFLRRRFSKVRSATHSFNADASERNSLTSGVVACRAVSPDSWRLPASKNSFDHL